MVFGGVSTLLEFIAMLKSKLLRFTLALAILPLSCPTVFSQTAQSAANPNATLKLPEVQGDGRVTFRIYAPKAGAVTVTGDWIERGAAPLTLTKDDQGVWTGTAGPLAADIYSYSFTVDGVRTLDPKNTWLKPAINPPDMQFAVPGHGIDILNDVNVPHVEVHTVWYHSASLDRERRIHV